MARADSDTGQGNLWGPIPPSAPPAPPPTMPSNPNPISRVYRPPAFNPINSGNTGSYSQPMPAPPPPMPAPPPPPSIEDYLGGDTGYQQQLRGFGQNLSDFLADAARRRNDLQTNFGQAQNNMNNQKVIDMQNLEQDYGSRGMLHSGLYGKAMGDYNTEFNNRLGDLTSQENQGLGQLDQSETQLRGSQQLQEQAAREDAIRRRAAQYGI